MVNRLHLVLSANDRSYFAILKKKIHSLAVEAGFAETRISQIDIIIAEIVTNLVKHAGGGELLVKLIEQQNVQGLEIISIDNGPGMKDVAKMTGDGVSTKNTLGHGLGSIKRLSDFFQIYSLKNWGTVQLIRVFDSNTEKSRRPRSSYLANSIVIPKNGETACGDGFFIRKNAGSVAFMLGDGLGHGPDAEYAVKSAGDSFLKTRSNQPEDILRVISDDVKRTRGLVATVIVFDLDAKIARVCGVGNISTKLFSSSAPKNYLAYNGIIGMKLPNTLKSQETIFEPGQFFIMCSDGIKSRWDTQKYQGINRYDPSILCAAILKDFNRHTDDVSVAQCQINYDDI